MSEKHYLISGHLEHGRNHMTLLVAAKDLAHGKAAFKLEFIAFYEPSESDLWNGNDDYRGEVFITFAQELGDSWRINATQYPELDSSSEDNSPVC